MQSRQSTHQSTGRKTTGPRHCLAETVSQQSEAPSTGRETLVARLTAPLPSAIATVAVRGPDAEALVLRCARLKTRQLALGRIHFGFWPIAFDAQVDADANNDSDPSTGFEHVVVARTSDCQVEIHCHGGNAVSEIILRDLSAAGAWRVEAERLLQWTEYPLRAAAESALLQTATEATAGILLDQVHGALTRELRTIIGHWETGQIDEGLRLAQRLLHRGRFGIHLVQPWRIVLAGPPNVGKSSLLNAIVGDCRAIVHPTPGTTRDSVESEVAIGGWPVSLSDTAGVRESDDAIEAEGVRRAWERMAEADIIVLVVDGLVGWTSMHEQIAAAVGERTCMVAWNKCDLASAPIPEQIAGWPVVPTIALGVDETTPSVSNDIVDPAGGGVKALVDRIAQCVVPPGWPPGIGVPFRAEHVERLRQSIAAVQRGDPIGAVRRLRRLMAPE